jgi:hypothetical protein
MSVQADQQELTPARRHRQIAMGLLRALATTVVLVALYYLLPLNHFNVPLVLVGGLVTLVAVILVQLRVITKARNPTLRAIQALAVRCPCSWCCSPRSTSRSPGRTRPASAPIP